MIFNLVLILMIILIIYYFMTLWKFRNSPPGPLPVPIVGYLPWINSTKPYETLTNLSQKYGSIYSLWMGNIYTVVLTDPKIVKKVLLKDSCTGRAPLYLTHGLMNGNGLICAQGPLWKNQRKFVQNCLRHFGAIKNFNSNKMDTLINDGVFEFLKELETLNKVEEKIDILQPLRHCLGNIISKIVFGQTWMRDDALWNWLLFLQEEGTKYIGVGGAINFLPILRFVPSYRRVINFLMEGKLKTHKIYRSFIAERKQEYQKNSLEECSNIIDAFLMETEKRILANEPSRIYYTDEQFYHLLADIFGASLDTTLTTLRWFFLYMAVFPKEQINIQNEIDTVLEQQTPGIDDQTKLNFTQAAIAETQRIRSVVPLGIPHGAIDDTFIEGFSIPKGTMIIPLQWAIHMNPSYWENPEMFNPSRFINEEGKFFKPDCFIPFQTGKRVCVGEDLARMFLFLFATAVLQKFHISLPPDCTVDLNGETGITLTPKNHYLIFSIRYKN